MPCSPSRLSVLPLVLLVGVGLTGCSSESAKPTSVGAPTAPPPAEPTSEATSSAPATGTTGASLKIASFAYDPTPLTVAPGTTIPVKNSDSAEHTVTSDMAGLFLADDIAHGKTVTFKAPTRPGKYTFHCEYHPNMHGTLVVT